MIRRIIKIAITVIICALLVISLNLGTKKLTEIRYQKESIQQEAIKNKDCKTIFSFNCPKKGGECKMEYDMKLYFCTKEGKTVDIISKVGSIIIIVIGFVIIGRTIYRNRIL